MSYKIYKLGAYVVIEDVANGTTKEFNSTNVQVIKTKTDVTLYSVLNDGLAVLSNIGLASILDANGVVYVEADWDVFRYEQTGSVNSSEVANPYPAPTTAIVNISSAQILAMGTSPIVLLPAPGVGKYYQYYGFAEYTHVTTGYTGLQYFAIVGGTSYQGTVAFNPFSEENNFVEFNSANPVQNYTMGGATTYPMQYKTYLNDNVVATTFDGANPTLGDGTLRVIITYTVKTFGA